MTSIHVEVYKSLMFSSVPLVYSSSCSSDINWAEVDLGTIRGDSESFCLWCIVEELWDTVVLVQ